MIYDTDIHHRRSIRLKGYNYSEAGAYFVTICTQDKECLFGKIVEGKIIMNSAGEMIQKWWIELTNKFRNIQMDEFIIMPNHMHGIIFIVGAALCGRPDTMDGKYQKTGQPCSSEEGQPHRVAPTLGGIMDWFKTMTTNDYIACVKQYGWPRFNRKLWQRNYYERIIRNEPELNKIREYIITNPLNWATDENYRTD